MRSPSAASLCAPRGSAQIVGDDGQALLLKVGAPSPATLPDPGWNGREPAAGSGTALGCVLALSAGIGGFSGATNPGEIALLGRMLPTSTHRIRQPLSPRMEISSPGSWPVLGRVGRGPVTAWPARNAPVGGSRAAVLRDGLRVGPCRTVFLTKFGVIAGSPAVCAMGRETTKPVDNPVDNLWSRCRVSSADLVDKPTTKLGVAFLPHPNMLWF